ncbi:SH3 domain-containing protein [Rhizobium sp. NPDC090275]|uniref:SH3 domain-containing protein n=1 Tax=Rhizobium sp. NPDC090275 TaxID=3364498 RepID=UPI00383AD303
MAFDDAMKVALAVPEPRTVEIDEGENNDAAAASPLSPLGAREVPSSPKIFDETAEVANQMQGASRERVRTTTDLNLREGPDPAYLKVETLANGTILLVLEKDGKWWRVKSTTTGKEGWINGTYVKSADMQ